MNLESQVTSLELSKKLKELGVKQESLFYWHYRADIVDKNKDKYIISFGSESLLTNYSAFTASELLEMLPSWSDISKRDHNDYVCRVFEKNTYINHHSFDENASNACAKMLIHLIENKLLDNK